MTPYQQSLLKEGVTRTAKHLAIRLSWSSAVLLLGIGFFLLSFNKIQPAFNGWLVILAVSYIAFNFFLAGVSFLMWGASALTKFVLTRLENEPEWQTDTEALKYKCRTLVITLVKRAKILSAIRWEFVSIYDAIADVFLFCALVTSNHPYIAIFHAISLVGTYYPTIKTKKILMSAIELLPDPLEQTGETNLDDLMDKLCNPEKDK